MAAFSKLSESNLIGVHPRLAELMDRVTEVFDCAILSGVRNLQEQQADIASGKSQTLQSEHLVQPDGYGHAVDAAPTPQQWDDSPPCAFTQYEVECIAFQFFVKGYAKALGLDVTVGSDWNNNNRIQDNSFQDVDHIELTNSNEPATPLGT